MSPYDVGDNLEAFMDRRLGTAERSLCAGEVEPVLTRVLAASIGAATMPQEWQRRPSLCHDGMPILLSLKLSHTRNDALRLLVEPGSLTMTVAQQIAFSLTTLDRLLGLLSWRSAAEDLNIITAAVLPADAESTREWWGGIWLGASVFPYSSGSRPPAELRIYLNLRHGDGPARWQRLAGLFSCLSGPAFIESWLARVTLEAIPVGLGVVVVNGQVGAIRIYVAAKSAVSTLVSLCQPISPKGEQALMESYESFVAQFGVPAAQTVTLGYDFVRDKAGDFLPRIGRVKVELYCEGVAPNHHMDVVSWVEQLLTNWSFDVCPLRNFVRDVEASWARCEIEHVSLGFAPNPDHVTVYVKPCW